MKPFLLGLERVLSVVSRVALLLSAAGLVLMTGLVAYTVFGRYVLNDTPDWAEVLPTMVMAWFIFLGAAVGVRESSHLGFDVLLGDIRQVVSALRRHDGIDLAAALRLLVEVIPGVQWQLELQPELRVDRVSVAEVLLRGAQEAITNALRHGQARAIQLRLWQARGAVQLSVAHGGAVVPVLHEGNGLTGMRERVQAIGGALELERPASGGLTVRLSVPVDAPTGGMA